MRRRAPALLLAAALPLAAGCGEPSSPAAGCPGAAAGEEDEGLWAERGERPELVELWRAGGLVEEEGLAFPVGIAAGPDHRVAVPDFRLGRVFVIGPDGRWEGSWTRRGEGPGEVLRPVAASWTEEGRLVVFDIEGARVVWLDSARAAARTEDLPPELTGPVVASGSLDRAAVAPDGTAFLRPGPEAVPGEARAVEVVTRARPGSSAVDTLLRDTVPSLAAGGRFASRPLPGAPRPAVAPGSAGGLWRAAPDGSYRIVPVDDGEGTVAGARDPVACRDVEPAPLTPAERGEGEVPEGREELARAIREAPEPDRRAAFGRFFVGRGGRIWVQRDRPDPTGSGGLWGVPGARYEVFAAGGRYLGAVDAPAGARLQAASGDTAWALEFGELDQALVVAYELRTSPGPEGGEAGREGSPPEPEPR